jgi:hypothetical protein
MGDFSARVGHLRDYFISDNYLTYITCTNCEDILQPDTFERALLFDNI